MSEPSPTPPAPVVPRGTVTTRLIHRGARGPQEWWRSAAVYVNEPPLLHAKSTLEDVEQRLPLLRAVSRLGAQAVRIGCPPIPGEVDDDVLTAVHDLMTRTKRTGLRVTLRIDPLDARDEASAAYWLARGADGLDLGPVTTEAPVSHQRYRELHALLAEHGAAEYPILSTRLSPAVQHLAAEMLHEDWLHHLVDTSLLHTTDPAEARAAVTENLQIRDALGTTGAWLVPDVEEAGSSELALASALTVLGMPGAVYLRQGVELGLPVKTSPELEPERTEQALAVLEEQRGVTGSHFETFRAALRLRADHRLGLGSMAWVEDVGSPVPDHVLAFVTGEMLVITNTGTETYPLPADLEVLLSSAPLESSGRELPPHATAWLWLEPAEPVRDPRARR